MKPEQIRDRRLALGLSQAELAGRAGTSQQNIDRIERGLVRNSRFLAAVVNALTPTVRSIASFVPPPAAPELAPPAGWLPVFDIIPGPDGAQSLDRQPNELAPGPPAVGVDASMYGVRVTDVAMAPAFEPGDVAWIDPRLPARPDANVLLRRPDKASSGCQVMVRRLLAITDTGWRVRQHNPEKTSHVSRELWPECHRIVARSDRK